MLIVTGPAGTAGAAVVSTTALTVGAARAAPALGAGLGLCAAGPIAATICVVGAAAAIGGSLYLTRDTWMPYFGFKGGTTNGETTGPGRPVLNIIGDPFVGTTAVMVPVQITNPGPIASTISAYYNATWTCSNGGVISNSGVAQGNTINSTTDPDGQEEVNVPTCGAGSVLVQVTIFPNPSDPSRSVANTVVWTNPNWSTSTSPTATDAEREAAQQNADATWFRTSRTCITPAGVTQTVVVEAQGAPVAPSCSSRFGAGSETGSTTVKGPAYSRADLSSGAPPSVSFTNPIPSQYPDCARGACQLSVQHRGVQCSEGATACVDWTRRALQAPLDYSCRYGPYTLDLNQCNVIERLYENGGAGIPATTPNIDGNPDTQTPVGLAPSRGVPIRPVVPLTPTDPTPQPTPTATGTPQPTPTYTLPPFFVPDPNVNPGAPRPNPTSDPNAPPDPATDPYQYPDPQGQPYGQPQIGPDGQPIPGTGTGPGGAPGTGPGGAAAPGAGGDPLLNSGNSRCWPNGWGWFNPAEWVLRPLGCAFIPSPATTTRLAGINQQLAQRPPVTIVREAGGVLGGLDGVGGSCWVQQASLPGIGDGRTITVLDTCTPGPVEGAMMTYRPVLLAAIWIAVLSPLMWWAWREYAPGSKGVA